MRLWLSAAMGMAACGLLFHSAAARADRFTYVDQDGHPVTVEARLAGSGGGFHALELATGEWRVVPESAVTKREAADNPEPMTPDELAAHLSQQYGADVFRSYVEAPYVIGLVLAAPLPPGSEKRAVRFMKRAAQFMGNMEKVFLKYVKDERISIIEPRFPMVMLIFESDRGFDQYATQAIQGQGLSAPSISGFYSIETNFLSIRMSECTDFKVPLHEAIHQQVYNREMLKRLAPIPSWFNEGIATGFEGDGERINIGPAKVNPRYARMALTTQQVDWSDIVDDDQAFGGDVLAGEAYADAWSLHWLLITRYESQYANYVKLLAQKAPLAEETAEVRRKEFEEVFGKGVTELQGEFRLALKVAIRRQRVSIKPVLPPGLAVTQSNLGEVQMAAVSRGDLGGALEVSGRLTNISPFRPLAFYVTVETDVGTYADWHVPELGMNKSIQLRKQYANKLMQNGSGGPSKSFLVRIRSTPPESDEAARWKEGALPVPAVGK